jgi:hypothetical protein
MSGQRSGTGVPPVSFFSATPPPAVETHGRDARATFLFAIRDGQSKFQAMSVEQIEAGIRALPPEERAQLVGWFDEHRHELAGEAGGISPAVRAELELRLKETDEHPELLEPFEEADVERMFKEIADARAQKTSARQG